MGYQEPLRRMLDDMREESAANARLQKDAQAISETLGRDQTLYVAAWANHSPDDFVSLWCATCLSVGVKHDHKAVSSEDFAKKVVELGSAAGHDFKALKEVIRRYKNVQLNADTADSGLKLNRHKKIELSQFINWAARKNWKLPKGLPGRAALLAVPDELNVATSSPAPGPQAAPMTPVGASGEVEADKAGPAPLKAETVPDAPPVSTNTMKKAALIAALEHKWPSIEADIKEATRNGLKAAAHTGKHGEWDESKARAWATSKGKTKQTASIGAWPGAVTRLTSRY